MSEVQRRHESFMRQALELAQEAAKHGDVPVGCVIARGDVVVGTGANEIERTGNPTRHAELVAIESATQHLDSKFLDDCTLYVTLEPCAMCAGAIVLARIPTLVYGASDEKTGAVRSVFELADDPRLNHRCIVRTGVMGDECREILKEFFEKSRTRVIEKSKLSEREVLGASSSDRDFDFSTTRNLKLSLVPTPIGNLSDITIRSLKTLQSADVIVCEDTRSTGMLLKQLGIVPKKLVSSHEHNEEEKAYYIVSLLRGGQEVALVSDAGMPAISDPGYRTVRACVEAGIRVEALPGPSALTSAIAASGLPTDSFFFAGFPPQKKGRKTFVENALNRNTTVVFYESPYRVVQLIEQVRSFMKEAEIVVARELSKLHEEYLRGTASELLDILKSRSAIKGECVVMVNARREQGE